MASNSTLMLLEGGDCRSIGRSEELAAIIAADPTLFSDLVEGLWAKNPVIRMRAADAIEKATRHSPGLLNPFKAALLRLAAEPTEPAVRWHLALLIPRLKLSSLERQRALSLLRGFLEDRSSIVKTFSLQALANLARGHVELRAEVTDTLIEATQTGTAAMKARARKLLYRSEKI